MINISTTLEEKFASDSVHKDVRITFPFGEHEDLTNSDIISESLSFTERICSADTLKFGLAEANTLQFKYKGTDITGMTINAEIGVDGEYIPLGQFVVESVERDSTISPVRSVTAYSVSANAYAPLTPIEIGKRLAPQYTNTTYKFDINKFIASNVPNYHVDGELTLLAPTSGTQMSKVLFAKKFGGSVGASYYVQIQMVTKSYKTNTSAKNKMLYYTDQNQNHDTSEFVAVMQSLLAQSTVAQKYHDEIIETCVPLIANGIGWYEAVPYYASSTTSFQTKNYNNPAGYRYLYPRPSSDDTTPVNAVAQIGIPNEIVMFVQAYQNNIAQGRQMSYSDTSLFVNDNMYSVAVSDSTEIAIARKKTLNGAKKTAYICDDTTSVYSWLSSQAELEGKFVHFNRFGVPINIELSQSDPIATIEKDAVELDTMNIGSETSGIGTVVCKYGSSALTAEANESGITYDLSGNLIIDKQSTEANANTLVSDFATKVKDIRYIPMSATIKGVPQVEAGDKISIDGVDTYVLTRTMKGIQHLMDEVGAS